MLPNPESIQSAPGKKVKASSKAEELNPITKVAVINEREASPKNDGKDLEVNMNPEAKRIKSSSEDHEIATNISKLYPLRNDRYGSLDKALRLGSRRSKTTSKKTKLSEKHTDKPFDVPAPAKYSKNRTQTRTPKPNSKAAVGASNGRKTMDNVSSEQED